MWADVREADHTRLRRLEFIGNAPALEVLRLNNNGMGPQGGAMIAGALLENAKKAEREGRKSRLRVLVCGESVPSQFRHLVGDSCQPMTYGYLVVHSQAEIASRTVRRKRSPKRSPRSAPSKKSGCRRTGSAWRASKRSSAACGKTRACSGSTCRTTRRRRRDRERSPRACLRASRPLPPLLASTQLTDSRSLQRFFLSRAHIPPDGRNCASSTCPTASSDPAAVSPSSTPSQQARTRS